MIKKDFKKAKVNIRAGYYHGSYCIFDVDVPEKDGVKTIARIDTQEIEDMLSRKVKAGEFEFSTKGRKYQYLTLK